MLARSHPGTVPECHFDLARYPGLRSSPYLRNRKYATMHSDPDPRWHESNTDSYLYRQHQSIAHTLPYQQCEHYSQCLVNEG